MNIKIGDRVRIKTEQELLVEGWTRECWRLCNGDLFVWASECGCEYKVEKVDKDGVYFETSELRLPIASAKVIPQTLDEYICSLPLEERAEKFIYNAFVAGDTYWYSTLIPNTDIDNLGFWTEDEALQATIEALKSPKEKQ